MDKISDIKSHQKRARLRKYRANDSLNKYKKTKIQNITNLRPQNINIKQPIETSILTTNVELSDMPKNQLEQIGKYDDKPFTHSLKRLRDLENHIASRSVPRYHFLKRGNKHHMDSLREFNTTSNLAYYPTQNDVSNSFVNDDYNYQNQNLGTSFSYRSLHRNYSRPHSKYHDRNNKYKIDYNFPRSLRNFDSNNFNYTYTDMNNISSTNISDNSKTMEMMNYNNILKKQNKELRERTHETRNKINDLLNNIKMLRMENQRLNSEKKQLLMKITNLENELDYNKNMSLNELDAKDKLINKLNEEIIRLSNDREDRGSEKVLNNNNDFNNIKNNNNPLNKSYTNNKYKGNDTQGLNDNFDDEIINRSLQFQRNNIFDNKNNNNNYNNNNINNNNLNNNNLNINDLNNIDINEFINQIDILQKQIEQLKYEKQLSEQQNMSNSKANSNEVNTYKTKINELMKDNENIKNLYNELNNEYEKIRVYCENLENNQNNQQNNFNNNFNNNNSNKNLIEINNLKNENQMLKEHIQNMQNQMDQFINSGNNMENNNMNNDEHLMALTQENDELKNHVQLLENQLQNVTNDLNNVNTDNNNRMNMKEVIDQYEQKIKDLNLKNKNLLDQINNLKKNNTNNNQVLLEDKIRYSNQNNQLNNLQNNENNNVLQSRIQLLEKQLNDINNKYQANLNELKNAQNQNLGLTNLIKNKDNENNRLKIAIENLKTGGLGSLSSGQNNFNINDLNAEIESLYKEIDSLKKELESKNEQNEELEKEIENYKTINNKLLQENKNMKEKINLYENEQDEGLLVTLENLKEEIKDKNIQIEKLIKQNETIRRSNVNFKSKKFEDDEKELFCDKENNPFRATINSNGLTDQEKVHIYKEKIKEYKMNNESDQMQIKALKAEIKEIKLKVNNLKTLNGQVRDMFEFVGFFNTAFNGYKPKKKEQRDAYERICQILNNFCQ